MDASAALLTLSVTLCAWNPAAGSFNADCIGVVRAARDPVECQTLYADMKRILPANLKLGRPECFDAERAPTERKR